VCIYDFFLGIYIISVYIYIHEIFCIYIILLYVYICMRRRVCDDEGESENEKKTNVEKIRKRQILKINEKEIQIGKKVKNRKFRVLSSNSFNIKYLQTQFY